MKRLNVKLAPFSCYFVLLGPNILITTLFSNNLSLCSPLNVREQIPHQYKTTGRSVFTYYSIILCQIALVDNGHVDAVRLRLRTEPRPPMGLLFILQVIHKHGEPWRNNIDRGKVIPGYRSTHSVAKQEELAK
jgi:hypothetical protein